MNFWSNKQGKQIYNSPKTSYPETMTVRKLIKMRFFYYKDILYLFLESPEYYTYQKSHLGLFGVIWGVLYRVSQKTVPSTEIRPFAVNLRSYTFGNLL